MFRINLFIACLFITPVGMGVVSTQPADSNATTKSAEGPSATEKEYLSILDRQDRPAALALWDTSTPALAQMAGVQVDMMRAICRLKRAVAAHWGQAAPYDLQMAVVGVDECGEITDTITGDTAVVQVQSKDTQGNRGPDSYHMVKVGKKWLLSAAEILKEGPQQVPAAQELTMANHMVKIIDDVGKDVQAGKCADINDVLSRISNGTGSP